MTDLQSCIVSGVAGFAAACLLIYSVNLLGKQAATVD